MEYYDEEYLKLFKKITEEQQVETKDYTFDQLRGNVNAFNGQMLKETPNYVNYNTKANNFYNDDNMYHNINEVQRHGYSQDMNLNEFNIETRINGQNINEVKRQEKEDKLFEVMEHIRQEKLNEIKQTQENQSLNESINFSDADVVTLEMFERARYNSMMQIARRVLPK